MIAAFPLHFLLRAGCSTVLRKRLSQPPRTAIVFIPIWKMEQPTESLQKVENTASNPDLCGSQVLTQDHSPFREVRPRQTGP